MIPVLVTTSQFFGVLDLISREVVRIHEGDGCYTGITWDYDHVYVIALCNDGDWSGQWSKSQKPTLLTFDKDLKLVGRVRLDGKQERGAGRFAVYDPHELLFVDDPDAPKLLVTDTGQDQITDLFTGKLFWRAPNEDRVVERGPQDTYHLNSLWHDGDQLVVIGQGWEGLCPRFDMGIGVEEPWHVKYTDLDPEPGIWAHSYLEFGADRFYIASAREELRVRCQCCGRGWAVDVDGFGRGLAHTGGSIFVGVGARGSRPKRHYKHARVAMINPRYRAIKRWFKLPAAGQVYGVRPVGLTDWGHHGDWGPACPAEATLEAMFQ